ncbi:DNA-binding domain-containing protein [Niveibacterium umoris]|uniref:Putative DNA-binding domain-containing protein n=1 Tax=Niveibacterium umoris TaxID=1193620 RepID=A0A840BG88_9RHOO|nr:DNA-binding domain-containing protein [Niveibacterium umoris]MBB4011683.1 hypothetical protein [Niveibacterium umoris]
MNTLHQTQCTFQQAILTRRLPDGLLADSTGTAAARFEIYAEAYRARLLTALRDNYPVLRAVLGDEDFDALGLAYIAAHPSRHPSIRWFGDALHAFATSDPARLPHPALGDLIRMEWALRHAFDADDATPWSLDELASTPPEGWHLLRFALHPSACLLDVEWAVEAVWHQLTADPDASVEPPEEDPHTLLIWRQGLDTRFRSLDAVASQFIYALADGATFGEACEQVSPLMPEEEIAQRVTTMLAQFIADEVLIRT